VVAVKTFRKRGQNGAEDVKREVDALVKMNQLGEEHIVRFITSFRRGALEDSEYYVLLEWADGGDLNDFWHRPHKPKRSASLVKWVVEQLYGLAKALSAVHHMPDGVSYSHGDLKPGNILWFPDSGGYGTLKIGDWGAVHTHNEESALLERLVITTAKYGTRRYEPPETTLQRMLDKETSHARSRLYDTWSMGCIILEFIIWLLYNSEELRRFNNSNQGYFGPGDMFYEISHDRVARIHRVSEHWMEHMSKDGVCRPGETALGDILHVVRTGLLVVELPKDDGLDLQASVGLSLVTHDDSPLISLTTPESTDSEILNGSSSKRRTRFRADELERELLRIAQGGEGKHYWFQNQEPRPAPEDMSSWSNLLVSTSQIAYSNGLRIPTDDPVDYAHPPLDPEEWEFELDNSFAATLSSRLKGITGTSPHRPPSSAGLCTLCRDFRERILDADFAISYPTQTLRTNSKAESCHLCCMLWQTCRDIAEGRGIAEVWTKGWRVCRDILEGRCKSVPLERVGSTLLMRGMRHPVLTLLRSDGESPL